MKILILKIIKQIIYRYSIHTPASVTKSLRNMTIGYITMYIDDLINQLKNK